LIYPHITGGDGAVTVGYTDNGFVEIFIFKTNCTQHSSIWRSLYSLRYNLASQILRHLFSFPGMIACIAIVLPDFLMYTQRDRT
jgi:hypothetical protein